MSKQAWAPKHSKMVKAIESRIKSGKTQTVKFDSKKAFFKWLDK